MNKVIQLKLSTNSEQFTSLKETMFLFNDVCNFISNYAYTNKRFNKIDLQHELYYIIKEEYNLTSQLIIRAIKKVADAYKINKNTLVKFKKYSCVIYDSRVLSYQNDVISIWTVNNRQHLNFHQYNNVLLKGEADLILKGNSFYLIQTIEVNTPEIIIPNDYLGIDLGIVNILVDSDGQSYSGKIIDKNRKKRFKLRQKLQKKNTRSSKRRIKRLSNKEARFNKDVNHCISKNLISKVKDTCRGIVMEELHKFSFKTPVKKSELLRRNSWSFRQLLDFISYKSLENGIDVKYVNPAYTSQRCSNCSFISKENRITQEHFECLACGFAANADYNAALNIRATVN